jgi:colicin import membrane protein
MMNDTRFYGMSFGISLIIHLGVILGLCIRVDSTLPVGGQPTMSVTGPMLDKAIPEQNIVQAVMVDETLVQAQVEKVKHAEREQKLKTERLQKARLQEQQQVADLKREKEKKQKELAEMEERFQEERQRVMQVKKEREQEEKKQQQAAQANAKRQAALQAATAHQHWLQTEEERYWGVIAQRVRQTWNRPPGLPEGLVCRVGLRLLLDGTVSEVKILESSGNIAFDRATEAAIRKASPLPVPTERELLDRFQNVAFKFDPQAI